MSVRCPFTCEYLREARKHESMAELDYHSMPNQDVEISREFLIENAQLAYFLGESVWLAAASQPEAVDTDVREALDALIRTYRMLETGLVYETRPDNRFAASIASSVRERIATMEQRLRDETVVAPPRDSQILGALIFLQRVELQVNNGRKLSRAFLDAMRQNHERMQEEDALLESEPDAGHGGLVLP